MSVKAVYLSSDTYLACLTHAFYSETEEVMGLLIGNVTEDSETGEKISHVESIVVLRRSDRKPDRVEISPLQLTTAAQEAEKLSADLGRPLRVLGWYHSHPHITIWPSHVDVKTQATYQMMDPDFVGLIFSVYEHESADKFAATRLTCFQAEGTAADPVRKEIAVFISPPRQMNKHCIQALVEIPQTFHNEEVDLFKAAANPEADVIAKLHNEAVYMQSTCLLIEKVGVPLMNAMEAHIKSLQNKLDKLKERKQNFDHLRK